METDTTAPKAPITLSGNIFSPQLDKEDLTAEAHHNAPSVEAIFPQGEVPHR